MTGPLGESNGCTIAFDIMMHDVEEESEESDGDDEQNIDFAHGQNDESEATPGPSKKQRRKKTVWSDTKPPTNRRLPHLKRRSAFNIVHDNSGPVGLAKRAMTALAAFLVLFTEKMMNDIVTYTNMAMDVTKQRNPGINLKEARAHKTTLTELKCLFGLLLFRGVFHDTKQRLTDLWYGGVSSRPIYRACFSLKRYQWLMRHLSFHHPRTIAREFLQDRFARMRKLVTDFESNCRRMYRHGKQVVIDETLRPYYARFACDFKVYMPDKPGKYGLLFRTLADCKDRFISRIVPYVTPAINNTGESEDKVHHLVVDMCSDLAGSGRNVTGDRFYSSIDTAEELHRQKLTYVGTVMSRRVGVPTEFKKKEIIKEREVLSTKFKWKKDSPVMMTSYVPKKGKNVLLMSTMHEDPDICPDPEKKQKPKIIDFYNQERCGVDIVNEMIKDHSSQPVANSWPLVVFTFILDLAAVNARTILGYNCPEKKKQRRVDFLKDVGGGSKRGCRGGSKRRSKSGVQKGGPPFVHTRRRPGYFFFKDMHYQVEKITYI